MVGKDESMVGKDESMVGKDESMVGKKQRGKNMKAFPVESCFDCPAYEYVELSKSQDGGDKCYCLYEWWCGTRSEKREIDIDYVSWIQDWCPLKDYPEGDVDNG